ncbi:MAG: hypothetical protein MZV64_33600 [Ignavibacteriales bacterium]|nr:hypothetical protein [Ignavibacteriales bacterium]
MALDVLVGPALARQALVVPDGDRLVPVAELHIGDAVRLLPAENPVRAFSDGHERDDDIPGTVRPVNRDPPGPPVR